MQQSKLRDKDQSDYVIAVVGHSQTGKSTVIRKAFKAWGMTEPVEASDASGRQTGELFGLNWTIADVQS